MPVPKVVADTAFDASGCIGCGACVAACPNGAANLFTSAKISHLNLLPQGQAQSTDPHRAHGGHHHDSKCEVACPQVKAEFNNRWLVSRTG